MIGMMYLVLTCLLALNVSKDILKGFVTVNESLEKTNQSMLLSNEDMLKAFEAAAQKSKLAALYYPHAVESQSMTLATVSYIEDMKKKLMEITEKVDPKIADTMQLRFSEKMDDYDIPTYQLIGDDETSLSDKPFSALELRNKLTNLNARLSSILDSMQQQKSTRLLDKNYKALKTKIDLIKPSDTNEMEDDRKVTWEIKNFYHLPLAAVITNLSKIQSDIRNLETEMLNQLASAAGNKIMKIDQFSAKVIAPSKYIRSGEEYRANIFLAGSSSNFNNNNMQVLIGAVYDTASKKLINEGTPVEFMNGMGNYNVRTSGQGEQSVKGVIRFKNEEDEMEYYPFEDRYTVAQPVSAVSADYMNVFYAGLDNAVTISAAGISPDKLVVKVNGNNAPLMATGNGKYRIKPVSTGTCEIGVYSREADGQLKLQGPVTKFRIKAIPTPFVKLNGKYALGTLELKKTETNALAAIGADIPGFDLDAKFKVRSFVLSIIENGKIKEFKCNGNNFTAEAKTAISNVKPGSKVFLEDIMAVSPTNSVMPLGNVTIKVKG